MTGLIDKVIDLGVAYTLHSLSHKRKARALNSEIAYNKRLLEFIQEFRKPRGTIFFIPFKMDIYRYLVQSDYDFKKIEKETGQNDFVKDIESAYNNMGLIIAYWEMTRHAESKNMLKDINLTLRLKNILDKLKSTGSTLEEYTR